MDIDISSAWTTADLLERLCEATDILLHKKDYDGDGWEILQTALKLGRERVVQLRSRGNQMAEDTSKSSNAVKAIEHLRAFVDPRWLDAIEEYIMQLVRVNAKLHEERDGWHHVVQECEQIFGCPDTAVSIPSRRKLPVRSHGPDLSLCLPCRRSSAP